MSKFWMVKTFWFMSLRLKIFIAFIITYNLIFAVPSISRFKIFTQQDGSKISISLTGDEHCHYYITTDSIPIFFKDKSYYYGDIKDGKVFVSDILAHDVNSRYDNEKYFEHKKGNLNNILKSETLEWVGTNNPNKQKVAKGISEIKTHRQIIGKKKGLVILVNFSDCKMSSLNPRYEFNRLFNETGYSDNGHIGSVHDYFYDQSYGKFNLEFDVVGPVTLSKEMSYYGSNSSITGGDARPYEMVVEACQLVDEEIDFSQYDWDGDGEVEQVFIIYAGYGEHAGAPSTTIWPHKSTLRLKSITLDDVKIDTYACSCELQGINGNKINGIGTPCHEFSHCLGFPDIYDTDYSGAFGMSYWDIMNSGAHSGPSGNGEVPYGYSAYERWMAGWLEPSEISESCHITTLRNLGKYPDAYIIYNDGNRNEFFMIENHQNSRWFQYVDTYTDNHGMMVTHIDYDETIWKNNNVNQDPQHQRMTIVPADNSYGETETNFAGDLFPGLNKITSLTDESHKNSGGKLFNPNSDGEYLLHKSITDIKESDKEISFNIICSSNQTAPIVTEASEIDFYGYKANWLPFEKADYYEVQQVAKILRPVPQTKTETKSGIEDTSYKFSWIYESGSTKYRVRAIYNGIQTAWSEYQEVQRPNSGINEISHDDGEMEIWGLDGIKRSELTKGINIVRKNGKVSKVVVD